MMGQPSNNLTAQRSRKEKPGSPAKHQDKILTTEDTKDTERSTNKKSQIEEIDNRAISQQSVLAVSLRTPSKRSDLAA